MDGGLRSKPGEITGVLAELDDHEDAIAYDLARLGIRLTDESPLSDVEYAASVLRGMSIGRPRDSAYLFAKFGREHLWREQEELLASLTDNLRNYIWWRGGKKGPKPKTIPRPWEKTPSQTFGAGTSMKIEDFEAWLAEQEGRAS